MNFRLDIDELSSNINDYKKYENDFINNYVKFYNILNDVDSAWRDQNTSIFLKKVSNNDQNIKKYMNEYISSTI